MPLSITTVLLERLPHPYCARMTSPRTPDSVVRLTPEDVARLRDDRRARSSLEIGAVIHVVQPLGADLLATLCFYAVFATTGSVGIATILAAALGVGQLAWGVARRRPVPPIQWASLLLVFLVGGLSLATGDPRYVLYKAAIIYVVIGCTMLRRGWLGRYVPPIALAYLPVTTIVAFGYMWAALLLGTGLLSLVLIWTVLPRTVALIMGLWAPSSKLLLLAYQYSVGRNAVRRSIVSVLGGAKEQG